MPDRIRLNRRTSLALLACLVLVIAAGLTARLVLGAGEVPTYVLGFAVGSFVVGVVLPAGEARDHDNVFARELSGRVDERDRVVWRRAWGSAGKVGLAAVLIGVILSAFGLGGSWVLLVIEVLMVLTLIGTKLYFDRTT